MNDKNTRKTLANCKLSEFTKQAMQVRYIVNEYYTAIDFPSIIEKYKDRDTKDKTVFRDILNDVLNKALIKYPEQYVRVIAAEAFLSEEEAELLDPTEALEIFLECAMSQRVLDFFINVERMAQTGTDGILPVLIFLRQIISETSTSEFESQNNTSDIAESAHAGDMSANA